MAIPDNELGEKLQKAHQILLLQLSLSSPPDRFLDLLGQTCILLSKVNQSPAKPVRTALSALSKALVIEELMEHEDLDVRACVAVCINEIIRIFAPEPPYDDDKMKDVFKLIVSSLKNLSDKSSRSYGKSVRILETMVVVKYYVLMIDLECSQMTGDMFRYFLESLSDFRDNHEAIFAHMETIMSLIIEECEDVSADLINLLLATTRKNNQAVGPNAKKIAEQVIRKCAGKLGPLLSKAVSSSATSFDHYSAVIASVCRMKNCSGENISRNSSNDQLDMVSSPRSPSTSIKDNSNKVTLATSTKEKRGRHTDKASEAINFGENLVGAKVRVWWPKDRKFYEGVIDHFYPVEKKHKVVYTDGDVEVLNLIKERWIFARDHPVTLSEEGPGIESSSHGSSSDMQRRKKGARASSESSINGVQFDSPPESKPKGSGSKARLTSIDEIAEPTSKNQISKPSRDSEDNTKCENSPQNLVESCNNSAKPSDRTDDVNNSKISSHLKQHRQSTAKSKVKAHMIKTPGSVGIGYLKCH